MATAKEFERRQVVFDRVEGTTSVLGNRTFELSQELDALGAGIPTVTWIYDTSADAVTWSSPIEELFDFGSGTPGFSVCTDAPDPAPEGERVIGPVLSVPTATPAGAWDPATGPTSRSGPLGELLLDPVLEPLRAQLPPSEFELRMRIRCPDGTGRIVLVRASPAELPSHAPTMVTVRPRYYLSLIHI